MSNSVWPHRRQPTRSPVPGILKARTLEWVAISFSNAWEWKMKVRSFSHVWLLATPWTVAQQAPPSMGFSRREYLYQFLIFASLCRRLSASSSGSTEKNLPAIQYTQVWSLWLEDPLEEGMATHFSILAWRIPWTEKWGYSEGCKESDMIEVTEQKRLKWLSTHTCRR